MNECTSWEDWHFVYAAEQLGVGQATVSRRIAQVESAVGHRLFDRHRTGLVPTAACHALRPHLEALEVAARGAGLALEGLEVQPEGLVRVAAPPGICADWMPRLARQLAKTHPGIRLEVLADVLARDLERREADIAIRMIPSPDSDLLVRRLATSGGALYGTPALIASLPSPLTIEDVPIVHWGGELSEIGMARFLRQVAPHPPVFATNDYLVLRQAVLDGLGASLLSHQEAARYGLVQVPIPLEIPEGSVYLVVHRALRRVPRVAVVIEAIDRFIEELIG
jgi:DNA-binding transcriptional LysR family regulator